MIDYSKIRFFSKSGYEIPYDEEKKYFFTAESELKGGRSASLYGLTSVETDGTVSSVLSKLVSIDSGILFSSKNGTFDVSVCTLYETLHPENKVTISVNDCSLVEISVDNDSTDIEHTYYGISSINKQVITKSADLIFPSVLYTGVLNFENVSTELYETETVYILKEEIVNGVKTYSKINYKDVENGRYRILFLIDSSVSNDFKTFTVDEITNDLVFNNSQELKFTSDNDITGYKVNISFTGKDEGVYEEYLYICIIDTKNNDEPYLLGKIKLHAEAIGEDERYRTLFTNFGIPDPKNYLDVFKDAGTDEDLENKELLNKKSKELFLTYDNIFPYVGTYKALINAVNYLGYNDVTFKEWYKSAAPTVEGQPKYVSYDVAYKNTYSKNKINTLSIEERLSIKKLNWLTLKYKLNSELVSKIDDDLNISVSPDIPYVIKDEYEYRNDELLLKLYSLKQWLEKYIIAQNCRIIEIVGEGMYVENYAYNIYGNVTSDYDFNSDIILSPYLKGSAEERTLKDGSAVISVGLKEIDEFTSSHKKAKINCYKNAKLEDPEGADLYIDLETMTVRSLSDGYDSSKADEGKHIIIDGTFNRQLGYEYITIKASNSSKNHLFTSPYTGDTNLWIHDNEILFEPKNYTDSVVSKCADFKILPEIYLEKAYLRNPNNHWNDTSNSILYSIEKSGVQYVVKNWATGEEHAFSDYPILKGTGKQPYFRYTENNYLGLPLFICNGFDFSGQNILDTTADYVLDIKDGKFAFESAESDKYLYLNFYYDENNEEQNIDVNTVYIADKIQIDQTEYNEEFIKKYLENPDAPDVFNYLDTFNIQVNKTGLYDVYVYGYDRYNNIYGKKVNGMVEVTMHAPFIEILAEQWTSNNSDDFYYTNKDGVIADRSSVNLEKENNPIFKPVYLINDVEVSDNQLKYKNISYAVDTPKDDDTVRLYNITDRFKVTKVNTNNTLNIRRTGTAASNCFAKKTTPVECVIFDTVYDYPVCVTDGSLIYYNTAAVTTGDCSLKVSDTAFLNYFKSNTVNPPHLYLRSKQTYNVSAITALDNGSMITIKTDPTYVKYDLFKQGQKIKLTTVLKSDKSIYSMGVYTVTDISEITEIDTSTGESQTTGVMIFIDVPIYTFDSTKMTATISYPNQGFVNYKVNVKNTEEKESGDAIITLDECEMLDFIDSTYSIGYRDFDIQNAYNDWIKESILILNKLYSFDIPVTLIHNKIICRAKNPNGYSVNNPTHYWIVYKQNEFGRTKYYELYNDSLFLNIDESGIYDVELWTYDNIGNLVCTENKGLFKK